MASEGADASISAQAAGIDWGISLESDSQVRMPSQSIRLRTSCDCCFSNKKSAVLKASPEVHSSQSRWSPGEAEFPKGHGTVGPLFSWCLGQGVKVWASGNSAKRGEGGSTHGPTLPPLLLTSRLHVLLQLKDAVMELSKGFGSSCLPLLGTILPTLLGFFALHPGSCG